MPLTELAIKNAKAKEKPYRVSDSGGLCLEVTPTGSKLWRLRYRFSGKGQLLSLGKYPSVSLAQARKLRDVAKEQVKAGDHPARLRQAQKLRRMQEHENTFEVLARRWHDLRENKLNGKYHTQIMSRMEQYIFPYLGKLPIKEITIPDVVRVVEKIGGKGQRVVTAKRMKQYISQIFRYAAQIGVCEHNPAADLRDILPSANKKHHACLPIPEIPVLLQKIDARDNDFSKFVLQLLALTFVRTGELIGAKWEEINWDKAEWHIPAQRMDVNTRAVVYRHFTNPLKDSLTIQRGLHGYPAQSHSARFVVLLKMVMGVNKDLALVAAPMVNPALARLVQELAPVWKEVTGRSLKPVSIDKAGDSKKHPFAEWVRTLIRLAYGKATVPSVWTVFDILKAYPKISK